MKLLVTLLIAVLATVVLMGCSLSSVSITNGTYAKTDDNGTTTLVFSRPDTMRIFSASKNLGPSVATYLYFVSGKTVTIYSTSTGKGVLELYVRDNGKKLESMSGDVYTRQK